MTAALHRIDLSDFSEELTTLSKLIDVKSLYFEIEMEVADGDAIDSINEFTFYKESDGEEFEHYLFTNHFAYRLDEQVKTMIAENILAYLASSRTGSDIYEITASGIIDFENFKINVHACHGSEYVSRLDHFTIYRGAIIGYTHARSGICLVDEIYHMVDALENKTKTNIDICTIKI